MGKLTKAQHITEAAHAHTNLTMMHAIFLPLLLVG